eukprot:TRINITY_DN480_c2_g1_i2.p1 TRINITY_DN480_c2_g1~~TRINITY_DN480_c2_g1_i2.p1  ORF type:complete len:322 (-),score=153.56 TRINITY_DN480_c2_g1_i2:58-966(-)
MSQKHTNNTQPQPAFEVVAPALPVLEYMSRLDDAEVLADTCWALSYLSDGPNEKIQAVIEAGVVPRLVDLLGHKAFTVQTPALRCIGNIVTGDDAQTQTVINQNALPKLALLLQSPKRSIRKETCWTLSNITAGSPSQIQCVLDSGVVPTLVHMLSVAPLEIRKEVCWALSNAMSGGTHEQIHFLVECEVIKPLVDMLLVAETKIVTVALEGLENILRAGAAAGMEENPYAFLIDEADGVSRLEGMHTHRNQEVYQKAMSILRVYYEGQEEEEDEALAPTVTDNGVLGFGYQASASGDAFRF